MRRVSRLGWCLGSPLALLAACWCAGLGLNLTGSLPIGLYLASQTAPVRGAIVLACLPPTVTAFALERGYVPRGGTCPDGALPAVDGRAGSMTRTRRGHDTVLREQAHVQSPRHPAGRGRRALELGRAPR